jgi:hypothetical protein
MSSSVSPLFDGGFYRVVESPYEKEAGIEIMHGEFTGVIYQYGNVDFVDGKPELNFQRTIRKWDDERWDLESLEQNEELNNTMGDILVELIQTQIKKDTENEPRIIEGTDKET